MSRRRKLLKSIVKKEMLGEGLDPSKQVDELDLRIQEKEDRKLGMLKNFNVTYLEEMLNSSTKSVAREVVSTLVKSSGPGVLMQLESRTEDSPEDDEEEKEEEKEDYITPKQKALTAI